MRLLMPGPHREQHALALVVAGAVLVGLAEVAEGDRAVDRRHDLAEGDEARLPRQDVAAADAALRPHDAGALEGQQDLLEVGLREPGALGDVAHRGGAGLVGVERERQQRPARVVAPRRHLHAGTVRQATNVWTLPAPPHVRRPPPPRLRPRLHHATWCRRCCTSTRATLDWVPPALLEADRVVLLVHRRARLEPAASRAATSRPRSRRSTAAPITTVAPSTTATALTSISTGLPAGRARRDGLPHRGRRRRAQRAAVDRPTAATPAQSIVPGELQPHAPVRRPAAAGAHPGGVRRLGLHPRPPRPGALHRLPHPRHAHRRAGAPHRRPASRSSTRTTRASTR